ncbi:site-specific integrase [Mesorhizobium microcysteis]|uniref:Site-specific integrase n=2 Tax=Neoaquamicrobium microcysteis TaxID=2682781 RepID=A0A5D4GTQ2_9HYPH|nr:site-specific integrase [Mesorhizobium microcysteis]
MARRFRDSGLESRAARTKLAVQAKPYYRAIGPGLNIGYRKNKKGGKWVARFYVGDKEYRLEAVADADDMLDADGENILDFWQAQDRARQMQADLSGETVKVAKRITVKEAVDDYIEWMEGNRKSAQDARYRADALILPALGDKLVDKLTAKEIRSWLRKVAETPPRVRSKKGAQPKFRELDDSPEAIRRRKASANRTLTVLKAALNRAWRDGSTPSDSQWRRVEPYQSVDAARARYLTVAEAQRLVNASDHAFRLLVQGALQTGARYGELAALTVADFNPDVGTVTIRESKAGKARHVVLTDEGRDYFLSATAGRAGDELMFPNHAGEPWQKSQQARPMIEACERAKIKPAIGFHGLRHTWASLAVMNGVPLMVVARNLGHADTRMVEKHYGHLAPSFIADAIRAGAPRFGNAEPSNVEALDRWRDAAVS